MAGAFKLAVSGSAGFGTAPLHRGMRLATLCMTGASWRLGLRWCCDWPCRWGGSPLGVFFAEDLAPAGEREKFVLGGARPVHVRGLVPDTTCRNRGAWGANLT
ncbi:unnamed protein product [Hapterophycus canaliculatus]